jgi:hypothetical protein
MATMRLVSIVLKVLAGLVAFVLLFYVALNLGAVAEGVVQRHRLSGDVTAVLPRMLPSAEQAQDELVDSVGRDADRRWIEQACRFDHDDGGWIVMNWREVCVMRSVTAWQVPSEQAARDLVPTTDSGEWGYRGCTPLGTAGEPGVVTGPEATYVVWVAGADEPWCLWELGPAGDARTMVGERVALQEGRWLVLVSEQPLVDEDIGCVHWSVLFCENPWSDHVFGDVPAR